MTWFRGDNHNGVEKGDRVIVLGTTTASKKYEGWKGRVVVGGSYSVIVRLDGHLSPTLRFFCAELRYENIVEAIGALDG